MNTSIGEKQDWNSIFNLINRIKLSIFGNEFRVRLDTDQEYFTSKRLFIQLIYSSPVTKEEWKGRKWYLSPYSTDDEIVKTVYLAFEVAVKHEILEGFKVDGLPIFNPHVDFEALLKVCKLETTREQHYTETEHYKQISKHELERLNV